MNRGVYDSGGTRGKGRWESLHCLMGAGLQDYSYVFLLLRWRGDQASLPGTMGGSDISYIVWAFGSWFRFGW